MNNISENTTQDTSSEVLTEEVLPEEAPEIDPRYSMNAFERFYSNFDNVPLKALDIFIGVCIVALIAVVTIGILRAH